MGGKTMPKKTFYVKRGEEEKKDKIFQNSLRMHLKNIKIKLLSILVKTFCLMLAKESLW